MGITMSGFEGLLASLQAWVGWLAEAPRMRQKALEPRASARCPAPAAVSVGSCAARTVVAAQRRLPVSRPLRVVRVMDSSPARAGAGRMVISGRMADVCAELDRLAALEAAAS